jgi:hypothetical protein
MSAHRKPKQERNESDKRYEAVLKHSNEGVRYREFFDDPDVAKRWIFSWWAELCVPLEAVDAHCAAAIYDRHDSRKCVFTMGGDGVPRIV